jgi:hypothetical protein
MKLRARLKVPDEFSLAVQENAIAVLFNVAVLNYVSREPVVCFHTRRICYECVPDLPVREHCVG